MIVVDRLDPSLLDVVKSIFERNPLAVRQAPRDPTAPLAKLPGAAFENAERQQQILGLDVEFVMRLDPPGTRSRVEDRFLEIGTIHQLSQIEVVPMLADTVERLVQRRESLLAVEHEERVLVAIQRRRAFKFARSKDTALVSHPEDASSGIVAGNRDD